MIWFEFTATDGARHIINGNHIIDIHYSADVDMTVITMDRAGFESFYLHGNKATELAKIIARSEKCISHRIGE